MNKPKTTRRTPEEMIAAREAEIEVIQQRMESAKNKKIAQLDDQISQIQIRIKALQEKREDLLQQIQDLASAE